MTCHGIRILLEILLATSSVPSLAIHVPQRLIRHILQISTQRLAIGAEPRRGMRLVSRSPIDGVVETVFEGVGVSLLYFLSMGHGTLLAWYVVKVSEWM